MQPQSNAAAGDSKSGTPKAAASHIIPDPQTPNPMRVFTGPDGTNWRVEVQSPGASNAMVVFRHPDGRTARGDRYAWYITRGAEALDVTARLDKRTVLDSLTDVDVRRLFRRSMPIWTARETTAPAPGGGTVVG
jgi:hypothetical protein